MSRTSPAGVWMLIGDAPGWVGGAPAESTYTAPRSSATSVAESTRTVLEASSLRCTPLVSVMASVPAEVVTVAPDITAAPAVKGAGDPVAWSMCATRTGAGVRIGRQIATAMTTEAAAASSTATVSQRRRVFWAGDVLIAPRAVDRRAHTREPFGGDRAARVGQSHETGHLVVAALDAEALARRRLGVVRLDDAFLLWSWSCSRERVKAVAKRPPGARQQGLGRLGRGPQPFSDLDDRETLDVLPGEHVAIRARQMIERDADTVGQVVSLEFGVRSRPIVRE